MAKVRVSKHMSRASKTLFQSCQKIIPGCFISLLDVSSTIFSIFDSQNLPQKIFSCHETCLERLSKFIDYKFKNLWKYALVQSRSSWCSAAKGRFDCLETSTFSKIFWCMRYKTTNRTRWPVTWDYFYESWDRLHPGWRHLFWTDDMNMLLMKCHFPIISKKYQSITILKNNGKISRKGLVKRADMIRHAYMF